MARFVCCFLLALPLAACPPRGPALPALRGLAVSPEGAHVAPGQQLQLRATAEYADDSRRDVTAAARWAAPADAGLVVSAHGRATARSPGPVAVEASFQDASARTLVVVDAAAPVPRALAVTPAQSTLPPGGAVALAATAADADGGARDATWDVAWASSRPDVAAFADGGPPGLLEAMGPGDTLVTATFGALTAEARVHVASFVPARAAFPLHVCPSGRFLVDAQGVPFRLQGEGAWSLLANLTPEEVDRYLKDRRDKGFNALLVNLVEYRFAARAPSNRAGQAPFRTPGDFATPEEAYFRAAAQVVEKARAQGFLVLLAPAYLGGGCPSRPSPDNEGWSAEMQALPQAACLAYGRFVGSHFRAFDNVVWVQGGDCLPTPGGPLEACALQVLEGLKQAGATQLQTGHWSPGTTALDEAAFAKALQLDAVYQYRTPAPACRRATARVPPRPTFLIESGYENESIQGSTPPSRKALYWAALTCTAGVFSGNLPMWRFAEGWQAALDSPGAEDVSRMAALFQALPWEALVPEGLLGMRRLVLAGGGTPGGEDEVVAAATPDGQALVAYVPPGSGRGQRQLVVDVRVLSGPAAARWYNPWTGAFLPVGRVSNTGPVWFTTPGDNGSGYDDWVLVLTRPLEATPLPPARDAGAPP